MADLGGWEVAYAIRYSDINQQIAANIAAGNGGNYPGTLNVSETSSGGVTITVSSDTDGVAPWKLVAGGSGSNVVIGITITGASITGGSMDYVDGVIEITLPAGLTIDASGTVSVDPQTITSENIDYQFDTPPGLVDKLGADVAIKKWLGTLTASFAQQLTAIEVGARATDPAWDWLLPQVADVVVSETGDDADNALVLVAMVSRNTAPSTGTPTLTNISIPTESDLGYFIDAEVFMRNTMLPGVHLLFDAAKPTDFTLNGASIASKTPLSYDKFKVENEPAVKASITEFSLAIAGELIQVKMKIEYPYKSVQVSSDIGANLKLVLKDGLVSTSIDSISSPHTEIDAGPGLATATWLAPLITTLVVMVASGVATAARGMSKPSVTAPSANATELGPVNAPGEPVDPALAPEASDSVEGSAGGTAAATRNCAATVPVWAMAIGGMVVTTLAGVAAGLIPQVILDTQRDQAAKYATAFDNFMLNAVKPITLPDHLNNATQMAEISIADSIVIGSVPAPTTSS